MLDESSGYGLQCGMGYHYVYQQFSGGRNPAADVQSLQGSPELAPTAAAPGRTREGQQTGVSHRANPSQGKSLREETEGGPNFSGSCHALEVYAHVQIAVLTKA